MGRLPYDIEYQVLYFILSTLLTGNILGTESQFLPTEILIAHRVFGYGASRSDNTPRIRDRLRLRIQPHDAFLSILPLVLNVTYNREIQKRRNPSDMTKTDTLWRMINNQLALLIS